MTRCSTLPGCETLMPNRGPNTTGQVDWPQALAWGSNLVVNGGSGWRLPTMVDSGAFLNLARGAYTTGLEYVPLTTERWMLDTDDGFQFIRPKNSLTYAMVVRDGAIGTPMPFTFPDPAVVPVPQPQSYAMMIIGLGVLAAMVRRNKQRSALCAASEAQRSSSP